MRSMLWPVAAALLTAASPAPTPCCRNLGEVRTNIDRIDDQILRLMAERSRYVAQAGRFKTSAATVRDEARIRQILARIREKAVGQGVNPMWRRRPSARWSRASPPRKHGRSGAEFLPGGSTCSIAPSPLPWTGERVSEACQPAG
jgi:isochorismate pyruvate lyase